jgi:hypothetical protein
LRFRPELQGEYRLCRIENHCGTLPLSKSERFDLAQWFKRICKANQSIFGAF